MPPHNDDDITYEDLCKNILRKIKFEEHSDQAPGSGAKIYAAKLCLTQSWTLQQSVTGSEDPRILHFLTKDSQLDFEKLARILREILVKLNQHLARDLGEIKLWQSPYGFYSAGVEKPLSFQSTIVLEPLVWFNSEDPNNQHQKVLIISIGNPESHDRFQQIQTNLIHQHQKVIQAAKASAEKEQDTQAKESTTTETQKEAKSIADLPIDDPAANLDQTTSSLTP